MKNFKKIMALVVACVMIVGTMSLTGAATGEMTPDTSVTVGGLEVGDEVSFYKLIKWTPSVGWEWADGVETAATSAGVALPTLAVITGSVDMSDPDNPVYTPGVISAADGGKLAQVAQKLASATDVETVATGATSVTYEKPAYPDGATDEEKEQADIDYMGLYVALVKPAKADYLYNPIFVSADYNPDDTNTNTITVVDGTDAIEAPGLSYSDEAMAKKQKVELTKTSGVTTPAEDVQYDVKVGDTIPFTIDSIVPEFSTSYVDPMYEISDVMSTGLSLLDNPAIVVQVKDVAAEDEAASWRTLTITTDYTVTGKSKTGFTVALTDDYLAGHAVAENIKVTYSAQVDSIPDENVVKKDNTATVKFSNNPGDKDDYSLLEDKTYHYTFSLDANLLGNSEWENSELVKIGLSSNGQEIYNSTLSNGTEASVLQGAKFGLYTAVKGQDDATADVLYTNNNVTPAVTGEFISDANGKLNISGLDAGTYYLKEISAPAGYIKSNDTWKIVITPHYTTVPAGSYTNSGGILVNYDAYDYLDSYTIVVTNLTTNTDVTSSFTIDNGALESKKIAVSSTGENTTKLANTQGTELPSTGGMGTTLFYTIGAILVLGAGILLVSKRRMSAN